MEDKILNKKNQSNLLKKIIVWLVALSIPFTLTILFRVILNKLQHYLYIDPNNGLCLWLNSSFSIFSITVGLIFVFALCFVATKILKIEFEKNKKSSKEKSRLAIVVVCILTITFYITAIRNFAYCTPEKIVYREFFSPTVTSHYISEISEIVVKDGVKRKYINIVLKFGNKDSMIIRDVPYSEDGIKQILQHTDLDIKFDSSSAEEKFSKKYR